MDIMQQLEKMKILKKQLGRTVAHYPPNPNCAFVEDVLNNVFNQVDEVF